MPLFPTLTALLPLSLRCLTSNAPNALPRSESCLSLPNFHLIPSPSYQMVQATVSDQASIFSLAPTCASLIRVFYLNSPRPSCQGPKRPSLFQCGGISSSLFFSCQSVHAGIVASHVFFRPVPPPLRSASPFLAQIFEKESLPPPPPFSSLSGTILFFPLPYHGDMVTTPFFLSVPFLLLI